MSVYTYKTIISKAKDCKENIKKKKEIGISEKWSYYFAKSALNPKKDITTIGVNNAIKPAGTSINTKIYENDFKDMCKRFTKFVENDKNHRLPNYVTYKNYKITPKLFTEILSRILVWYDANGKMPNYANANSSVFNKTPTSKTTSKKKYGHATISGCDNRGQNNSVNCGPHSMQECIRNLTGKVIKQSKLAAWAGTSSGGTDHYGLETAIAKVSKELGVKLTCKWYNFNDLGWNGINKIIKSSNQDCIIHNLYRNKWGHYEVVNSISDSNVKVQNSLGNSCSQGCYCGYVEDRSTSEFKSYINGISQKSVLVITRG